MLLQQGAHVGVTGEIPLSARVATLTTHVNEICQRLRTCCTLVKIRTLSTEGVSRHDRL